MKHLKISTYINKYYGDDPVSSQTIVNWIKNGHLRGKKVSGLWFVCVDEESVSNPNRALTMLMQGAK